MKHYLVVFNRQEGSIVRFSEFDQAGDALTARFDAEVTYKENRDIEVVVLGAESDAALRRTHTRYFRGASEIAGRALGELHKSESVRSTGFGKFHMRPVHT